MKILALVLLIALTPLMAAGQTKNTSDTTAKSRAQKVWNFDKEEPGQTPKGWTFLQTHPAPVSPAWKVVADAAAPSPPHALSLAETQSEKGAFNLAIAQDGEFKDVDLSVKVKAVKGSIDQGGGPVWRCKDENNYYVCRINPLENNFRVYYVLNGRRTQLASVDVKTETGKWYTVRACMKGNEITCCLDGVKLLEAKDENLAQAGKVGCWTKADAASEFDELTVEGPEK